MDGRVSRSGFACVHVTFPMSGCRPALRQRAVPDTSRIRRRPTRAARNSGLGSSGWQAGAGMLAQSSTHR
ncbi:hypothetical protein BN2497_1411 [Janthinobacterium sp. CG23_2]|nr:hypothetical protein BN2497_1411 [Janthinobacterium sp. CG23_2]CUU27103.1 hypothetical protein BN3177_1411 [Janthinobacterium sp. CG23_2]